MKSKAYRVKGTGKTKAGSGFGGRTSAPSAAPNNRLQAKRWHQRESMMKLDCQYVSASEAGDEIFQVEFEAVRDQEDGPYLLLQRAFLEEDEGDDSGCYIETNEERLIGHYRKLSATLKRNRLTINLPPPINETIEVHFQATDLEFENLKRTLAIVLQQNLK